MRESTGTLTLRVLAAALAVTCGGRAAAADPPRSTVLAGLVVAAESRWGYGGDLIVTETTLRLADGKDVVLHQLGGRVGDIAMIVTHSPPLLPVGRSVRVTTEVAFGESGKRWLRLTRVLASDPATTSDLQKLGEGPLPFVRSTNDKNVALFWQSGCATIGVEANGAATVPGDGEFDAIERSIGHWREALSGCSDLDLSYGGLVDLEPKFDGANVIRFREDKWCRPASGDEPEVCHDPSAAALTFLTFGVAGDRNGAILDADIEFNGVNFRLVVDGEGTGGAPCAADIENTLTHELGHFLGLDHTCWDGRGVARPIDDEGNPVPLCDSQLASEIEEATMFAFQECGETKKQSLEADDAAAVCSIYARAEAPGTCEHPNVILGGFCRAGGTGGGPTWLIFVALGLGLGWPARRRSRRRRG